MKIRAAATLALSFVCLSSAQAATRVTFVDQCSREAAGVTSTHGTAVLRVELNGLVEHLPLQVNVSIRPDETVAVGNKSERIEFRFTKRARRLKTTTVVFEKKIRFSHEHAIWNAHVDWMQTPSAGKFDGKSGSGTASIYVSRDAEEKFYRIQGPAICAWETPVAIASEYHFNASDESMHIQHRVSDLDEEYHERGLNLGIVPDVSASTPFLSTDPAMGPSLVRSPLLTDTLHSNFGWLFATWRTLYSTHLHHTLVQSWILGRMEGGFFGDRIAFERYPVVEFERFDGGKCDAWVAKRTGHMDAGRPITEFFSVPRDVSGDPVKSAAHMESMRPRVDTCKARGIDAGSSKYQVNPASGTDRGMLFFYPEAVQ